MVAAVNWIFSQVMVPESMELAYDKNAALYPAAKFPETKGENLSGATELYLIERDSEDENREEAQETKETKESADAARDGEEEGEEAEEMEGCLTQKQMAEEIGIKQPNYCKWEKGVFIPSSLNLQKIAETLGISYNELIKPLGIVEEKKNEEIL